MEDERGIGEECAKTLETNPGLCMTHYNLLVGYQHNKMAVLQIQVVLLVLNTFKLCETLKNCLVSACLARYTL